MNGALGMLAFVGVITLAGCIATMSAARQTESRIERALLFAIGTGEGMIVVGTVFLAFTVLWP